MKKPFLFVFGVFQLLFILSAPSGQAAQAVCPDFSSLVHNGAVATADKSGTIMSACNPDQQYIPASILKIATALAALDILGPDFRFATDFFVDDLHNLYISGYGDPFLISEEVDLILERLQQLGVERINNIIVDNSVYGLTEQPSGRGASDNPYDVPLSGVVVNFNTIHITVDAQGQVHSNEPQTPTLPLMIELGRGKPPGQYRLNICSEDNQARARSNQYAAELFRALQMRRYIPGQGQFAAGPVPPEARLVYSHGSSRSMEELITAFLQYSNNFIANQIFLACGTARYGYPASWEKGQRAIQESLSDGIGPEMAGQITMVEGSGLSSRNRITARAMLAVLQAFKPYASLLQEKKNFSLKSGTLTGTYNYAGYLENGGSFVILLNQQQNTRDPVLFKLNTMYEQKE